MIKRRDSLYSLLERFMIYPSRNKFIHRIDEIYKKTNTVVVRLNCGREIVLRDSRNSRAWRWIQKGYYRKYGKKCKKCNF